MIITTIRGRLVLLTLGLLVPAFIVGGYLLWDSYRNSRQSFERQLMETARALSLVVDRELGQAAALNRALATSSHLETGDMAAFDRQARQIEKTDGTWIVLSDETGQQLVNTRLPPGAALPRDDRDTEELWRVLTQGGTGVSNLYLDPLAGQAVIAVQTPVTIDGQLRYSLALVMLPRVFDRIMAEQKMPQGWIGSVLDHHLGIVARSRGGASVVGRTPSPAVQDALAENDSAVVESFSLEGNPTVVAFSRSPAYRWTFVVSIPRAQLLNDVTGNILMAATGGLALLVFAALMAALVARTISRPVEGLVQAAQALGRGEAVEPPATAIHEVNTVGQSLRNAAVALAEHGAELRASEARLRLSVQATGIGIWDVDNASGHRSWSPEFYDIMGLPRDTPPSEALFADLVHPDDREWVDRRYKAFVRGDTQGVYEAEFRIRRAEGGEERWVTMSGRLRPNGGSATSRAGGTIMDMTDRRRAEDILRESEERFRSMADTAPALIWMTDETGRTSFLNRYHETVFGKPAQEIEREGWSSVIDTSELDGLRAAFHRAQQDREPFRHEVRVRGRNGTSRWLRCEGAPRLSGRDGEFLGYVGCNVDITESKLASDALERRIEERTGELGAANRQLLAQIEERERVEETLRQVQRLEAVGQLTSGVAHDFNNLLTVILGNLTFLERGATEGPTTRRLSNMRMAAERGASLVAQLLAFSRRQRLEAKAVNLNETVVGMRELLQSSMGGSVAVDIVLDEDLWPALVDPTQMELIILNLAINARDAMDVGGVLRVETLNVSLDTGPRPPEEPASDGDYVVVSVSDSGSGMSEAVRERIFEPFFTTKEVGKGSGLGLSQVLGFAKQSGGGVRVETHVGKGTTVCVYMPRVESSLAERPISAALAAEPEPDQVQSILVVDDDELVREITASTLEEFGYRVVQAENGPSALMELEDDPSIELLVLDFAMPGMNGAEIARAARKRRPGVPLVFVTGYADLTALGELADEPILHKPFRDEDLLARVAELLKQAGGDEKDAPHGSAV